MLALVLLFVVRWRTPTRQRNEARKRIEEEDQERERALIGDEHLRLLHRLLDAAIGDLEHERQFLFDEESAVGPRTHRDIFAAHFPDLAGRIGAWNDMLFDCAKPEADFTVRIIQQAQQDDLLEGPYVSDGVVAVLRDATMARVRRGEPKQQAALKWERSKHPFGNDLRANETRVALGREADGFWEAAREKINALHVEIQSWPEVDAIIEAKRKRLLFTDREQLLADLRSQRKVETVRVSNDCELCRKNQGELTYRAVALAHQPGKAARVDFGGLYPAGNEPTTSCLQTAESRISRKIRPGVVLTCGTLWQKRVPSEYHRRSKTSEFPGISSDGANRDRTGDLLLAKPRCGCAGEPGFLDSLGIAGKLEARPGGRYGWIGLGLGGGIGLLPKRLETACSECEE